MEQVAVKIMIAGRVYPLTIDPSEEENLQLAAKNIEENIVSFQKNYSVSDKQDLLAMTALQMATQLVVKERNEKESAQHLKKLQDLDSKLSKWLEGNT